MMLRTSLAFFAIAIVVALLGEGVGTPGASELARFLVVFSIGGGLVSFWSWLRAGRRPPPRSP
jgi:hypothetical protein